MSTFAHKERKTSDLVYDTRPFSEKFTGWLLHPRAPVALFAGIGVGILAFPAMAELLFIFALIMVFLTVSIQDFTGLVAMLPQTSRVKVDPKNRGVNKMGEEIGREAKGIIFVGNDSITKEEVWLTDEQARTHMLFFGTTGSGKTEFLVSICFNALVHGSGLIYVDGKADTSLYAKFFSMARAFGRDDDVLLINFQKGARDIYGPMPYKQSNTLNMFSVGTAGMLSELVKALKESKDDDIWVKQADGFIDALIRPLVYMRDSHGMHLDVNVVREFFLLDKLEELAWDYPQQYPGLETYNVVDGIRSYLMSKPGYKREARGNQSATTHEQHAYISMQLMETFGSLADSYGYIMKTPLAEIDFVDVFLNRRILVVLLPALEVSQSGLTNLGRIVAASVKAVMAKGLGSQVEGEYAKVYQTKPTTAPSPFPAVFDEYGAYPVPGFFVVPAQARSLGFWANFAGQDKPGFERESEKEAQSTYSNTNTQFAGKITCLETYKFFAEKGGKGRYSVLRRYERDQDSVGLGFRPEGQVEVEEIDRVTQRELQRKVSGQWHMFFEDKIVSINGFYADPKPVKHVRVNHFLRVQRPSKEEVEAFNSSASVFERALTSPDGIKGAIDVPSSPADLKDINDGFEVFAGPDVIATAGQVLAYCDMQERARAERFASLSAASGGDLGFSAADLQGLALPEGTPSPSEADLDFASAMKNLAVAAARPAAQKQRPATTSDATSAFFADVLDPSGETVLGGDQPLDAADRTDTWVVQAPPTGLGQTDTSLEPDFGMFESQSEVASVPGGVFDGLADVGAQADGVSVFASDVGAPEPGIGSEADIDLSEPSADAWLDLEFDPPKSGEGQLDRAATVDGLAAIEQALGSTASEARVTALTMAEDLQEVTRYNVTPPVAKAPDLQDFAELAAEIAELLHEPALDA